VRTWGIYLGASAILLAAGAVLFASNEAEGVAVWVTLAGLLIRKGIVPLHSWMPDSFEHGHLVPAVLFHGPQAGTYAVVVLVLPLASSGALDTIGILALGTTIYAAVLAAAENDARRAFGYLFMSQSALVLAGIGTGESEGVAGSLTVWIASALSMGGLGLTIAALELRRGRLSLAEHHGGYEQMPLLAASFLVFGLATVGFPGTLGFLGEELLVGGSLDRFPAIGYVVIAATALNGITVLRMYFSLYCGRTARGLPVRARPRELAVFASVAVVLVVGGLFPRGMIDSRFDAAETALAQRALR
jgi:NADH-quinone oxidoreductase subunit M